MFKSIFLLSAVILTAYTNKTILYFYIMQNNNKIAPLDNETPSCYANRLSRSAALLKPIHIKQRFGQYFTPLDIAKLMADFIPIDPLKTSARVLDPGCGAAILSCVLIEKIALSANVHTIELVCYEIDDSVLPLAITALKYLKTWLTKSNIEFNYTLCNKDFILDNSFVFSDCANKQPEDKLFDFVISNPPFFKLKETDERIAVAEQVVFGQPNIYSLFAYTAAMLLKERGRFLFLIPRSFCSGSYFKQFRQALLANLKLQKIHLFGSGEIVFEDGGFLFESIIVSAIRSSQTLEDYTIEISHSGNAAGDNNFCFEYKFNQTQNVIPLPSSEEELEIIKLVNSLPSTLYMLNLNIGCGKVIRSKHAAYITTNIMPGVDSAPLYWLHNIAESEFVWPKQECGLGQYLNICPETDDVFIPNSNYVLLRRYSSKDHKRKIVAASYFKSATESVQIAIEKHLCYIYNPERELTEEEIIVLTAALNSKLLDDYFRIVNGAININMEEVLNVPLPLLIDISSKPAAVS
jgi:adenine-specific DNA-methyltransferase